MTTGMEKKKQNTSSRNRVNGIGRLQPQARDFEECVIGALLLEKRAFEIVSPILKANMFYDDRNAKIYSAIVSLDKEQKPVDMITVTGKLRELGELENTDGAHYIAQLTGKVTSSAHIEFHAKIIMQKYLAREVIRITSELQTMAFDDTEDIADVLEIAEKEINLLCENSVDSSGMKDLSGLLSESLSQMYERIEKSKTDETQGITTGLADLNRITGGWQNGELVIIAARPAMGKTAFSLHFAKSAAKSGVPVAMFSLEMTGLSLSNRLLLSESDIVEPEKFKSGKLSELEQQSTERAAGKLWKLPIKVDDSSVTTISSIKAKARLLKKKNQCGLIIIDYLQLTEGDDKTGNREQEIASISRGAKKIAKELNVPVILLSQLSRKVEERADKRPQLSDLRESGAIEQDADLVIFLYRYDYYFKRPAKNTAGNEIDNHIELIIAKYREGSTGSVNATHNGSLTKIFDYDYFGQAQQAPPPMREVKNYYEPKIEYIPF